MCEDVPNHWFILQFNSRSFCFSVPTCKILAQGAIPSLNLPVKSTKVLIHIVGCVKMFLSFFQSPYTLPKLSLSVYSGLNFSVAAYNWFLPDDHYIYSVNMLYTFLLQAEKSTSFLMHHIW